MRCPPEPSELGFAAPVGVQSGLFQITNEDGRRLVVWNGHYNQELFKGLTLTARQSSELRRLTADLALAIRIERRIRRNTSGPVPLDEMRLLLRTLLAP